LDDVLAASASINARSMRGRQSNIRIVKSNALDFDYDAVTVVYLFNPFGIATLSRVLERIRGALLTRPRHLRIAYANPIGDEFLAKCSWLERAGVMEPESDIGTSFSVSFWESRILCSSNSTVTVSP
jgi:hypothetical protein